MSFLQVQQLTKSVGDRILFSDVTFGVSEGDKIGIIAKNGTGKSTLLSIIAGRDSADSGKITFRNDLRVGYLEQTPTFPNYEGATVLDACLTHAGELSNVITEYEAALSGSDSDRLDRAIRQMDAAGAWDYEDRLKQLLTQLHITDLNFPVGKMSGGQQKRVALARTLLAEPQLLILDEPTNHLDIEVVEWLEEYLTRSRTTLLMVTHDRYFLDRVCRKIIEIDMGQTFTYDGNYDYYLRRRSERIEALGAELAKVKNTLRREQEWMRRQPQARAGKARYRINAFYDLKERSRLNLQEQNLELNVDSSYIGSKIFEARNVSKRFGDKIILDDFTYTFGRYEKVGIVGANGVGKSTFVKMLQGIVKPDNGNWNVGETVRFGYYSQEGISFNESDRVIDAITRLADDVVVTEGVERHYSPLQFLQRFLFTPADQQKRIGKLSGGERCRLHLATVLMRQPNFLILDEPTNDLDIVTLGILEDYLRDFKGCVIVISHDRFFLDSIVDHLFVMEGNGVVKDFPGTYSEFRQFRAEQTKAQAAETSHQSSSSHTRKTSDAERPRKMSFKEKREFEEIEKEMSTVNAEISEIETKFNSGEIINDTATLSSRYSELKERLDTLEMRWLELSELA